MRSVGVNSCRRRTCGGHRGLIPQMRRFGVAVLARAALEASARAWWHLDPALDITERVRRALAEQLASQVELERTEDLGEVERPSSRKSIQELVREADVLGFPVKLSKKGGIKIPVQLGGESAHLPPDSLKGCWSRLSLQGWVTSCGVTPRRWRTALCTLSYRALGQQRIPSERRDGPASCAGR